MSIITIDPRNDRRWHALVHRLGTSVFQSQEWMHVLEQTYGFTVEAFLLLDADEPVAGIPFCRIDDLRQRRIASLPFCDYFDPLVCDPAHWRRLVDRVQAEGCTFSIRPLHNDVGLTDDRLQLVNRAKWHGRCLADDEEKIWQSLHSSARRAIRKAKRSQVDIQVGQSKSDLRAFFELHLYVRKQKYRMVAQPYAFFESIWDQFVEKGQGQLLLARCQDEVVAGVLLLVWKDKLFYKFNASSPNYLAERPNDLLLWEAIRYGKARQLVSFDFGLSDWDQEGLIRYKRKYADREETISFLRYRPDEDVQYSGEFDALLSQLTGLFTAEDVPADVTEQAGNVLYRFFA